MPCRSLDYSRLSSDGRVQQAAPLPGLIVASLLAARDEESALGLGEGLGVSACMGSFRFRGNGDTLGADDESMAAGT